jgi:hypothetical protein
MTVNEMLESFLVYYDRITSFSAPGYEAAEKLLFLNNAQNDFIKDRMFGQNFQPPAFEDNQRRVADLHTLINRWGLVYSGNDTLGWRSYTLPTVFMFFIKAIAVGTRTNYPVISSSENFECDYIKQENIMKFTSSSVNKTHFIKPVVYIADGHIQVMGDRFTTISALTLQYLRKPTVLVENGTCDMPEHTHQEIVDMAVRQALQAIQDPRWQSSVTEEKIKSN